MQIIFTHHEILLFLQKILSHLKSKKSFLAFELYKNKQPVKSGPQSSLLTPGFVSLRSLFKCHSLERSPLATVPQIAFFSLSSPLPHFIFHHPTSLDPTCIFICLFSILLLERRRHEAEPPSFSSWPYSHQHDSACHKVSS